jgi:hypothetical protein
MIEDKLAEAQSCVYRALEEINATGDQLSLIEIASETELLGPRATLDSVGFAFLIITIEQFALDDFGHDVVLFDENAMAWDYESLVNPFYTVGSLTKYLREKMTI